MSIKTITKVVGFFGYSERINGNDEDGPKYRIVSDDSNSYIEEKSYDAIGDDRWECVDDEDIENALEILGNELFSGSLSLIHVEELRKQTNDEERDFDG